LTHYNSQQAERGSAHVSPAPAALCLLEVVVLGNREGEAARGAQRRSWLRRAEEGGGAMVGAGGCCLLLASALGEGEAGAGASSG